LEKAGPESSWKLPAVLTELFAEEAETRIAFRKRRPRRVWQSATKGKAGYREALQDIAGLRPAVDKFFDEGHGDGGGGAGSEEPADTAVGIIGAVFDDRGLL